MDHTLLLLFSLPQVLSMTITTPLPGEVVKMKSKVKLMADLLVHRLNENFKDPSDLTLTPPADELDGLSSIITVLDGYNSLISDTLRNVTQVKSDISSLTGYLDKWRQRLKHCSEQRLKPPVPGSLQELQSQKEFVYTVSQEALMRVKQLLLLLRDNLYHLDTC